MTTDLVALKAEIDTDPDAVGYAAIIADGTLTESEKNNAIADAMRSDFALATTQQLVAAQHAPDLFNGGVNGANNAERGAMRGLWSSIIASGRAFDLADDAVMQTLRGADGIFQAGTTTATNLNAIRNARAIWRKRKEIAPNDWSAPGPTGNEVQQARAL